LKKVGLNWISYGFESATSEILLQAEKGCKNPHVDEVIRMTQDEGVSICADVMFGLWEEDIATMERTFDFLVKYNFEWVNMYPVFPYPGTILFDRVQEPQNWKGYSLYGYECCPMPTKHVPAREVLKFRDEAFVRYHGRTEYLNMIEKKFGRETKEHILRMLATPLRRHLIEDEKFPASMVLK
jgi:anaerobic magnesium-protoporphyrin IX monomethyl ester cyclase